MQKSDPYELSICCATVGDCRAWEGELHELGCDYERCTVCGGQFLYCDCGSDIRATRKRVPFFRMDRISCQRCGEPWPDLFRAPDEVWKHYVLSLGNGNPVLCIDCMKVIIDLTDGGEFASKHEDIVMLHELKRRRGNSANNRFSCDEIEASGEPKKEEAKDA